MKYGVMVNHLQELFLMLRCKLGLICILRMSIEGVD
jgi:hypothetical protein